MSVRVVARVRPLLKAEQEKDRIVTIAGDGSTLVRIPNPRNDNETFSFDFQSVYDADSSQQELFDREVAPTVKHLFNGFDVTIFAYGVTGTGKTHTMRGGKSLADRGVIPRLLSSTFRRCRKIEKDSNGATSIEVVMTYYEIYNDKVYDLFEPPEKRTAAGLPIRDNGGKTVVCGLRELPCLNLKEFEKLYDDANMNRSTSATKLNAHSSRSHAILGVKLIQKIGDHERISTVSAIDLAGSEDNRRTENGKERMVESASINKSLFVLAQCVEAISKKQIRIPYRESKMTRILSLGQNNGLTLMILNLSPVRSFHLDTLSSLNFANRTKKIEVNEIENEFQAVVVPPVSKTSSIVGASIQRQPLRPLAVNSAIMRAPQEKPAKAFSVFADRAAPPRPSTARMGASRVSPSKRAAPAAPLARSSKMARSVPFETRRASAKENLPGITQATLEALIDKRLEEKLASQALKDEPTITPPNLPEDIKRRLEDLERRVEERDDSKSEGIQFLLMAKQHQVSGHKASALKMLELARPYFPGNSKLERKIEGLRKAIEIEKQGPMECSNEEKENIPPTRDCDVKDDDSEYQEPEVMHDGDYHGDEDDSFHDRPRARNPRLKALSLMPLTRSPASMDLMPQTPRTERLLRVINSRDVAQIQALRGVGAKRAQTIVDCLFEMGDEHVNNLFQLGSLRGVGGKTVENMRLGVGVL